MRASTGRILKRIETRATDTGFSLDERQIELVRALAHAVRTDTSLFVHGPAGRGKSWVTNAFFDAVPTSRKTRVHFHGFLAELHRSIHRRRTAPDRDENEDAVAQAIADAVGDSRLLFFDEFHVHDAGDARLLTLLLAHVFSRGVSVIITSNYAPADLLPDPLWHHLFEDGIALITENMATFELAGATDYRGVAQPAPRGFASGAWTTVEPVDAPAADATETSIVNGRDFAVRAVRDDVLWVTFAQLCEIPTATIEYLEWAARHPHWVITDLPVFADADPQAQQRFINVVDVLADLDVPTTFVSQHPLDDFLAGTNRRPDAFRMVSRLQLVRR
ncbi:cell division protein ZapE [uncultured Microbacterium sp.]|uniref:cell division protein ZapE n=1 Tax=uncultured Microbacterium sp. TaxID=191216 RepID=UPI0026132B95|nr:cell division protein ZapE [uncultured Microbacterium sp.]